MHDAPHRAAIGCRGWVLGGLAAEVEKRIGVGPAPCEGGARGVGMCGRGGGGTRGGGRDRRGRREKSQPLRI